MVITGYARQVVADLSPETIIAPALAHSGDPAVLAAHCLEAVAPALAEEAGEGDILVVAGTLHPGPPAAMEAAVLALQALGFAALVACAADPAWVALAGSYGLPLLVQPDAVPTLTDGTVLRLDLERGQLGSQPGGTSWPCAPCTPEVLAAVRRAQLLARMRRVVEDEGLAE